MRPSQRAGATEGLVEQFGLRGRISLPVDDLVVPTQDVGDFAGSSPWLRDRSFGSDCVSSPAAGAGRNSGVLITPEIDTILVVERLWVTGFVVGNKVPWVQLYRPVDVAAVNVTAANQAIAETYRPRLRTTGFLPQIGATYSLFDDAGILTGATIGHFMAPLNANTPFPGLGRGVVLDGTDPNGPASLAVINQIANDQLTVGFHVVEYPAR